MLTHMAAGSWQLAVGVGPPVQAYRNVLPEGAAACTAVAAASRTAAAASSRVVHMPCMPGSTARARGGLLMGERGGYAGAVWDS